jgi:SEC-C motif
MALRSEAEVFSDLETVCGSPGYIHAYSALVAKNAFVRFNENIRGDDFDESFAEDHLIRTELSTLLGLMMKAPIDFTLPAKEVLEHYWSETIALLKELQAILSAGLFPATGGDPLEELKRADFSEGAVLREPIFYTAESAYASQYRDLAPLRYKADDEWILRHKGFTISQAARVGRAILDREQRKVADLWNSLGSGIPDGFTFLPAFTFTAKDIAPAAGESEETVRRVLEAFSVGNGERNEGFQALNDFNAANATPMLRKGSDSFILFQVYIFYQSLYESPPHWMRHDDSYKKQASDHRGDFNEEFAVLCFSRVFGTRHIHPNVFLMENAATTAGEIDVLVLFGNRAIVLQTKSKSLTIEARKGNDGAIHTDFKQSIAESYEQALDCGQHLLKRDRRVVDADGKEIQVPQLAKIYLLCIVSNHYPALSLQALTFLEHSVSPEIPAPFVTDIFTLDVLTEMLESPLQFLSYIDRRTGYADRIVTGHELNILGYHLGHNLWISPDVTDIFLYDDVASSLNAAMSVRRDGLPGERTPPGILTITKGTAYADVIEQIDNDPRAERVDLGLMLLRMSSNAAASFSKGVEYVRSAAQKSGKVHDVTLGDRLGYGVTVQSSFLATSLPVLDRQVRVNKYRHKATSWFGIAIDPHSRKVFYCVHEKGEWKQNQSLEEESRAFPVSRRVEVSDDGLRSRKIGRNDPCPCNSGKKYKKCHLLRN